MDSALDRKQLNIQKTKRRHRGLTISIMLASVALFLLFLFFFVLPVSVNLPVVTYELGEEIATEPGAYVTGNPLALAITSIDMSAVDPTLAGSYEVIVKHGWQQAVFCIEIQDTTAPELVLKPEKFYLEVGEAYSSDFFIKEAYDASGVVDLRITLAQQGQKYSNSIVCDGAGEKVVRITAIDLYGNETVCLLPIVADTAPEITGCKEYYVAKGSNVVFSKEGISAYDAVDGDLSDEIQIDVSNVELNQEGIYEVVYSVTDRYGFTAKEAVDVNVMSAEKVQELINTHRINRLEDCIVGAYNLYDGGVYEEDNIMRILAFMEPALVTITNKSGRGSGFIVKITEQDIIICTNLHVTDYREDHTIFFHNGSTAHGSTAGSMDKVDISFVKVSLEDISKELLDTLKTVHIDRGYVERITEPASVNIGFRTLQKDGSVWKDKKGVLVELKEEFIYHEYANPDLHGNLKYVTQVTAPSYNGASGSAILDGHGNLISMVSFYFYSADDNKRFYYGMTLDDILKGYRQVFGEDLYYQ